MQQEGAELPPPTALPLALGFREQREAASRPTISAQAPAELPMPLARSRDPAARLLLPGPIAAAQPGTRGAIEPARPLPRLPRPWCRRCGLEGWKPASPAGSQRPRLARHGASSTPQRAARPTLAPCPAWAPKRSQSGDPLKPGRGAGAG